MDMQINIDIMKTFTRKHICQVNHTGYFEDVYAGKWDWIEVSREVKFYH